MSVRTKLVDGRPTRPTLGLTINRDVEYLQVRPQRKPLLPDCVKVSWYHLVITGRCRGRCLCLHLFSLAGLGGKRCASAYNS